MGLDDTGNEQQMAQNGVISDAQANTTKHLKKIVKDKEQSQIEDRLNSI